MSGGPYGRGKAPERACLPVDKWPHEDREVWQKACEPVDLLDEDFGARSQHAEISNRKAEKGYGRWITFLTVNDPAWLSQAAADRITVERVCAYVDSLTKLGNSTQTILGRLQELGEVARVMDPARSWSFIARIASKVRARHRPARDKASLRLSYELVDAGIAIMESAGTMTGTKAAVQFRDGLVIALLALVPLRRKNLADLRLGQNLLLVKGTWLLTLDESETKTHGSYEVQLPEVLREPLEVYLKNYRPLLLARRGRWYEPADDALWLSKDGSPMTQMALYDRVRLQTKTAFGNAMNPHLFRDAAATTLAIEDPKHVRVAAPLLGHRQLGTTERYYQQAAGLEAHRQFVDTLFGAEND
jgi:integrase